MIAEDDVAGIDTANVTAWLAEHVGATPPFRFDVIAGGHSNLTYLVQAADGRQLVLRRPPLGHVLASAHDMGREHRIIAGLQGSGVPIPPALGLCTDSRSTAHRSTSWATSTASSSTTTARPWRR